MPTFTRGNVTLHYELDGDGSPVVYINGFSAHSNDRLAVPIRRAFAERYQVLAVDNRGSGQTVLPDTAAVTPEDMADDIAALMEHHNMGAADVIGISMGGCIAMLLALRHPDKVRRLALVVSLAATNLNNSRAEFLLTSTREMRDQGIPREVINHFNAVYLLGENEFQYEGLMNAWINAPDDPYRQTRAGFDQQLAALRDYDVRLQIPAIAVPTLVISSIDDLLVPPRYQDEIAALIPGAQIKRYFGGHLFMLLPMYQPQFLEDVFAFFTS